jgi:hypothetical protein
MPPRFYDEFLCVIRHARRAFLLIDGRGQRSHDFPRGAKSIGEVHDFRRRRTEVVGEGEAGRLKVSNRPRPGSRSKVHKPIQAGTNGSE